MEDKKTERVLLEYSVGWVRDNTFYANTHFSSIQFSPQTMVVSTTFSANLGSAPGIPVMKGTVDEGTIITFSTSSMKKSTADVFKQASIVVVANKSAQKIFIEGYGGSGHLLIYGEIKKREGELAIKVLETQTDRKAKELGIFW